MSAVLPDLAPFCVQARRPDPDIVGTLLDNGADPNKRFKDPLTPMTAWGEYLALYSNFGNDTLNEYMAGMCVDHGTDPVGDWKAGPELRKMIDRYRTEYRTRSLRGMKSFLGS